MLKTILSLLLISALLFADENNSGPAKTEAYKIPFASSGNEIELTVANSSSLDLQDVTVVINNAPEWIKFSENKVNLPELKGKEDKDALFSFSIDKSAPVGMETTLNFQIITKEGFTWSKDIRIQVSAPEKFELYRNYPNPFNPSTIISYQLPVQSKVELKIYNMLGQEVAALVNSIQEPGYYPNSWNASNYSSGVYIYQIDVQGSNGQRHVERMKMMLLK